MTVASGGGGNTAAFAKTICSICYEDLKPITEDLQSISICGHVFHELCLQQWFEYCKNGKKKSCPVCKQNCTDANVSRLYFQSIGDPNDQTATQKASYREEYPEELRGEICRLEGKVSRLSSVLEQQQKICEASDAEVLALKEKLRMEEAQKKEALNQSAVILRRYQSKTEELENSTLESMKLQSRNMALAKELAALKLVADLDMNEDEIVKLACLGNEVNSKETVDVLKKSLVIRNKNYKELMTKCNLLGRGESRALADLKKAQEKIKKLKERVQHLESIVEVRDNETLRTLKSSRAATGPVNGLNDGFHSQIKTGGRTYEDQNVPPFLRETNLVGDKGLEDYSSLLRKKRKLDSLGSSSHVGSMEDRVAKKLSPDYQEKDTFFIHEDEDVRETSAPALHNRDFKSLSQNGVEVRKNLRMRDQETDTHVFRQSDMDKSAGVKVATQSETEKNSAIRDDDVMVIDDITSFQSIKINRKTPTPVVASSGDRLFAAALPGPDGSKWPLGKWCKRAQNKGQTSLSTGLQGSNRNSGDLIAVGADGRGGTIKVLRSVNHSTLDNRAAETSTRSNQNGPKSSSKLKLHGNRQIDQFFGRASQPQKL